MLIVAVPVLVLLITISILPMLVGAPDALESFILQSDSTRFHNSYSRMSREYYLPLVVVGVVFVPDKNPNYSDRLVYYHLSTIPDNPFVDWFGSVQKTNANDLEQLLIDARAENSRLHETVRAPLVVRLHLELILLSIHILNRQSFLPFAYNIADFTLVDSVIYGGVIRKLDMN